MTIAMLFSVGAIWQADTAAAATKKSTTKYWLKVNKQRGVVTAYKYVDKKWKPIRAMLASVGKAGTPTVSGTYSLGQKQRWATLGGPSMGGYSYGQYVSQITRDYLFHSVWYYTPSKSNQSYKEFNKLGSPASHGCVRLSTIDAKWIYDNCKKGTKITCYNSSNAGPLGKPKAIKSYRGWDPTDPTKGNPNFKLKKAIITVKKASSVQYGKTYKLLSGVKAKNPNANEDLTYRLKYSVQKYNSSKKKYVAAKFSTKSIGTYKITYKVSYGYCRDASKTFKVKVVDTNAPTISGATNRTVNVGDTNAVGTVTAKQASRSLTSKMTVQITKPDGTTEKLTYEQAQAYVFAAAGEYTIKYTAKNVYSPYKATSKTIKITVNEVEVNPEEPTPEEPTSEEPTPEGTAPATGTTEENQQL